MSINYKWVPTTPEIFLSIMTNHRPDLKIFNQSISEKRAIYNTEHGFKNSDIPLIKVRTILRFLGDVVGENEYWIELVCEGD